MTETVAAIVAAHRAGQMSPAETLARSYQRIRDHNDAAVFISLRDEKDALAEAEALSAKDAGELPLLGVPVAVKDNIDALGLPTTAACPAFSYLPSHDATSVAKLRTAGAIIYTFFDTGGNAVTPGAIQVNNTADFTNFFQSSDAGGNFLLRSIFPVTGDTSRIAAFEVEFANSAGTARTTRTPFSP